MPNYDDILSKKPADIITPVLLPAGTYLCVITGQAVFGESSAKKTPFAKLPAKVLQPMEVADPAALEAVPGGVNGKELKGRATPTFYLTDDALFMLDEFLTNTLAIEPGDKSLKERIAEAPGRQFLATIRHATSQDNTARVFAELAGTARA